MHKYRSYSRDNPVSTDRHTNRHGEASILLQLCCEENVLHLNKCIPQCMNTVDHTWHILPVIYVCSFWVENL